MSFGLAGLAAPRLKDRWGMRHWPQLHDKLGDVFLSMIRAARYVEPNGDPNASRWPEMPIWSALRGAIAEDLFEMRSDAEPQRVLEVDWGAHRKMLLQQCTGTLATVAALDGEKAENFSKFLTESGRAMAEEVRRDSGRVDEQFRRAQKHYAHRRISERTAR